jgi:hypothetical protein
MPIAVKRAPRIKSKLTNVAPVSAMKGTKAPVAKPQPSELDIELPKFKCGGRVKKK